VFFSVFFTQIHIALVSLRNFFQNYKNLTGPKM